MNNINAAYTQKNTYAIVGRKKRNKIYIYKVPCSYVHKGAKKKNNDKNNDHTRHVFKRHTKSSIISY